MAFDQTPARDWSAEITAAIVAQIDAGGADFIMPWHRLGGSRSAPTNAVTGAQYHGVNLLMLGLAGLAHATDRWATFQQWKTCGRDVAKGEHGSKVVFYKLIEFEDAAGADLRRVPFMRVSTVFNEDQLADHQPAPAIVRSDLTERLEPIDAMIAATGAAIRHVPGAAYYDTATDRITLPLRGDFIATASSTPTENYYATLFHELTHWTGHKSRMARAMCARTDIEGYAEEELIAELGAAFLCARLGVANAPRPDHAAYLANWLKALRNDKRFLFCAAADAQRAVDFLIPPPKEETK